MAALRRVKLSEIAVDETLHPRNGTSWMTVYRYMQAMRTGSVFPPVVCGRDAGGLVLLDGRHRLEAHRRLKRPTIAVLVSRVPRERFFAEAVRLNVANGQPLAVQELIHCAHRLRELKHTDAEIAAIVAMPVADLRRLMAERLVTRPSSGPVFVRKASAPTATTTDAQANLPGLSPARLLAATVRLFERNLIDWGDTAVVALVERLRLLLAQPIARRVRQP